MSSVGFIGTKLGMTSMWVNGVFTPITLVEILPNFVLSQKDYGTKKAVLLASVPTKESKVNKPQHSLFKSCSVDFCKNLKEFAVDSFDSFDIGSVKEISEDLVNMCFDVRAVSKGKGFQGAMKRHGFAGLPATHGVSLTHRSLGSTGNRTLPGRVFKNKKMAGRMGGGFVTMRNLKIVSVDASLSVVAFAGSIPGYNGGSVCITAAA